MEIMVVSFVCYKIYRTVGNVYPYAGNTDREETLVIPIIRNRWTNSVFLT